ncbi:hypothetical protein [Nonomuraea bangladeshensis]|uniref:hypothetical protein n=1 Tax=Nonomuraea bangladeshensis TaxID=404385 RepID=UPI003C2C5EE7
MTGSVEAFGPKPDITSQPEHVSAGQTNDNPAHDEAMPVDALGEARKQLARTHLDLAATRAGVDVSGVADFVNMDAFLADDGSVNADAVTAFVESLTPARPAFDQEVTKTMGVRNSEPPRDFTKPQDFKGMTRQQIEALVASGKLDKLIR